MTFTNRVPAGLQQSSSRVPAGLQQDSSRASVGQRSARQRKLYNSGLKLSLKKIVLMFRLNQFLNERETLETLQSNLISNYTRDNSHICPFDSAVLFHDRLFVCLSVCLSACLSVCLSQHSIWPWCCACPLFVCRLCLLSTAWSLLRR